MKKTNKKASCSSNKFGFGYKATSRFLLLLFSVMVLFLASVSSVWATTIEVSQPNYLTTNSQYDRNPSIINDGTNYWLFYTKGNDTNTNGVRGGSYNPDSDSYVVYYKTASTIEGLATASETKLALSESARPVNFNQRDVSAAMIGTDIYVFVDGGQSGTNNGLYYYKTTNSGSTWTAPTNLIANDTAEQGGHVNVVSDGTIIYMVWERTGGLSDFYTFDGTTLSAKVDISTDNQPKITKSGNTLYVVSIDDTDTENPIKLYKSTNNGDSWDSGTTVNGLEGFYDPTVLVHDGSLYVVSAPWIAGNDQQYLMIAKSTDGLIGSNWTTKKHITNGGYDSTYWWDYWPILYSDGTDIYLFFTTETSSPTYSDGEIAYIKMDWTLTNDHYFYIQNAIDAASPGDTINVAAGLYEETITIDKALTLLGATADDDKNDFVLPETLGGYDTTTESVIKAPAAGNPNTVKITSSNVILKGFVIEALDRSVTGGNDYNNLIELRPVGEEATMTGIIIENNVIGPNMGQETPRVNGRHGIRLTAGYGHIMSATITGNKIHGTYGNGNNVFVWGTALGTPPTLPVADLSGTTIQNNDISYSARSGIELSGAQKGLTIDNNRIYNNGAGHIGDDTNLKYGSGIMLVRDYADSSLGTDAGYVDDVTITNNKIYNNDKNGIYLGPMNKNHVISGNDIYNNGNVARGGDSIFGLGDGIRVDLEGDYYDWGPQYGSTSSIAANENSIYDSADYGAQVIGTPTNSFELDAENNYWNSVNPDFDTIVSGDVDYRPWYIDELMTTLNEEVTSCAPGDVETDTYGTNVGVCTVGERERVCNPDGSWGDWVIKTPSVGPVTEDCDDGVDNDCDGYIDADDTDCYISTDYIPKSDLENTEQGKGAGLIGYYGTWVSSTVEDALDWLYTNTLKLTAQFAATGGSDVTVTGPYSALVITLKDGVVNTLQLADNAVTDAKINDVDWSKLNNIPAGFADGVDNNTVYDDSDLLSRVSTLDIDTALDYDQLTDLPTTIMLEGEDVSLLNNDAGYITGYTETDPKFDTKFTVAIVPYALTSEIPDISGKADTTYVDTELATKQNTLTGAETIFDIKYAPVGDYATNTALGLKADTTYVNIELATKQDTLTGNEIIFNTWDKDAADDFTPTNLLTDYGFTDNSANWNLAFGWGDHSIVGYALDTALTTEINTRTDADAALQSNIGDEVTRATAAEGALSADVDAEEGRAMAAENILTTNLNTETGARTTADAALTTNLNTEIADRGDADATLQDNIDAEASTREAADTALEADIADLEERAPQNTDGIDIYLSQGWNKFKLPWFVLKGTAQNKNVSNALAGNYSVTNVLASIDENYNYIAYYDGKDWWVYSTAENEVITNDFTEFPYDPSDADYDFHIYMTTGDRLTIGIEK